MSGESEDELTLAEVEQRTLLRRLGHLPPLVTSSSAQMVHSFAGAASSPSASRKRPREPSGAASRPASPDGLTELAKATRPLLLGQEVADSVIVEQLFHEAGNVQTALATALVTASALQLDKQPERDGGPNACFADAPR